MQRQKTMKHKSNEKRESRKLINDSARLEGGMRLVGKRTQQWKFLWGERKSPFNMLFGMFNQMFFIPFMYIFPVNFTIDNKKTGNIFN